MKRLFLLLVSISFFSLFFNMIPTTSYAAGAIDEMTAENLVKNALEVFYHHVYTDLSYKGEKGKEQLNPNCNVHNPNDYTIIDPSKLIGGSLDDFYNHLNTIYTESLAKKYSETGYLYDSPMFVIEDDGDIFKVWEGAFNEKLDVKSFEKATVEVIENNGESAKAKVYLTIYDYNYPDEPLRSTRTDAWVECKFENTQSGWRISDCAFFDMLNSHKSNFEWTPVASPSTSDPAFDRIVLMTTVPIVCLVPAFYLLRRRRRNVIQ